MKFLVQHNNLDNNKLLKIKESVKRFPHAFVGVIPFSNEIISDELLEGIDYIPYGSCLLSRLANENNWKGIHYDLSKLNYINFAKHHPYMLNKNVQTVSDACKLLKKVKQDSEWFTRPSNDDKRYSGIVMTASAIVEWFEDMINTHEGSYKIDPNTEVVIDTPKYISAEWRWFIVGGKIVSGSMYRAHEQMRVMRELHQSVIDEAQAIADIWLPMDCVVMDTALVGDEVKVIEFNCINSSGFYDNDVDAVFKALWEYHN